MVIRNDPFGTMKIMFKNNFFPFLVSSRFSRGCCLGTLFNYFMTVVPIILTKQSIESSLVFRSKQEAYMIPFQTSMMNLLCKTNERLLGVAATIFVKMLHQKRLKGT